MGIDIIHAHGSCLNLASAVSVHYIAPKARYPLAMRLFLPESWVCDADRLDRAGVPGDNRTERTKGRSPWTCWTKSGRRLLGLISAADFDAVG